MEKINAIKGMIYGKNFLRKMNSSIIPIYEKTKIISNEELLDLEIYEDNFLKNIMNRMNQQKLYKLDSIIETEAYKKAMQGNSGRTRPLLFYIGNLFGERKISEENLISNGLSIEMIHKMGLIIDDYFDKDPTRKGEPSFYTIYDENVLLQISMLLIKLSNVIFMSSINEFTDEKRSKLIELYKQIIIDMGNGFIEDLDRKNRHISLDEAYRLNDMQSATIIKNSILLGYCISQHNIEEEIFCSLETYGAWMGRAFQGFNDIDNFLLSDTQLDNKSNLYSDLKANRKNIILAQIPDELFYPPYCDDDIIEYINNNDLIGINTDELYSQVEKAKYAIAKLPSSLAKDTLLFATEKITNKTLKKIRMNKV